MSQYSYCNQINLQIFYLVKKVIIPPKNKLNGNYMNYTFLNFHSNSVFFKTELLEEYLYVIDKILEFLH